MRRKLDDLSVEDRQAVESKILSDLVSRSSTLCYFFGVASLAYAFTSLEILNNFRPELTLWENLWPRIILNAAPWFILARWFQRYKVNSELKAWVSVIANPTIFVLACCIYAWPIMLAGDGDLYSYFHGANIYVFTMTVIITSPPLKFLLAELCTFLIFFFLPLGIILSKWEVNHVLLKTFLGDYAIIFILTGFTANQIYRLRLKVALSDFEIRKSAKLFLGTHLTDAIYDENNRILQGYTQSGSILALDIRGYTNFVHSSAPEVAKAFMQGYHELVTKTIGQWGGYIHKSSGDGHTVSFGVMEKEQTLSDIPGLERENEGADRRKMRHLLHHATRAFEEISKGFEILKNQYGISLPMLVGAGLSYGEIEVVIRGDDKYRKELDIDGESIVRAVRLESYSKFLNKSISDESSFMVISPEFEKVVDPKFGIRICYTQTKETAVRDYPWIQFVYFRQWKHNRIRSTARAA